MRKELTRFAALAAVLLAGSCAAPGDNDMVVKTIDPARLHPITVEPNYRSVRVSFAGHGTGLMPEDAAKLDRVAEDYLSRGNGSVNISVPEGGDSSDAISFFGERLARLGVPRSRILVGTHPVEDGDRRVEIGFMAYEAHTAPCGNWSEDIADTQTNLPRMDFGCSVQQNIAAMVANPRDLDESRQLDDAGDAVRRATVLGHYEKGEVTQADKRTVDKGSEQSGLSSDIQ
ncbi:MAG: CpaD family pilus assembly protein [Alphaproteobacteria bacterium]|jgi:pilus assembly protein CpaD|nr:CpaD family pilus assembly protein [Alphaproteobacteria bacterium]